MSEDLALQEGALRLQATSENLWMFSINITSPFTVHFSLFDPKDLHNYGLTCIILLSGTKFWSSSSLSLAFVMYTFNTCQLQATRSWKAFKQRN
jgi:hypothetical protein